MRIFLLLFITAVLSDLHDLKYVKSKDKFVRLVTQRSGYACSVILIANYLFFTNQVAQPPYELNKVSDEDLIGVLQSFLDERLNSSQDFDKPLIKRIRDDIPRYTQGMYANIGFKSNLDFGSTEGVNPREVFSAFGLILIHSWVVDPEDTELISSLEYYSKISGSKDDSPYFDDVVMGLQIDQSMGYTDTSRFEIAYKFIKGSQRSAYGVEKMKETMENNQYYAFIHADHYSLCFKNTLQFDSVVVYLDNGESDPVMRWRVLKF